MVADLIFGDYPGFLPGLAISILLGGVFRGPVGRRLGMRELDAWVLFVSLGAVVSATLTLGGQGFPSPVGTTGCDVSRIGPASLREYLRFGTAGLNVLLFIPLGWAITRVTRLETRQFALLLAVMLPIAIELTQLVSVPLGRACQVADVFDNLIGLGLGLAVGFATSWITRRAA